MGHSNARGPCCFPQPLDGGEADRRGTGDNGCLSCHPPAGSLSIWLAGKVLRGRSVHRAGAQLLWELGPPEQRALCTRITFAVREARPPPAPAMQLRL